jgi:isopenicillin N synthase-like dioxygenase
LRAVSQHGLDDLVERQFAAARAFFELPIERKMEIMVDKYHRCVRVSDASRGPEVTVTPRTALRQTR